MNRKIYWVSWIVAAVAFWLSVGWFGIGWLIVDPYFNRKVDAVAAAVSPGAPSKEDVAGIEQSRSTTFKAIGVLGGIFCGFAFGVAAGRFNKADR
ncbi:hypothetical protein [Polaromonas sp. LjRoot131]|uniref:hypothetical protein n=1 Tax=Polaromonas sp. LjRoot131 TaxID=3342262 RepID=UPI003ECDCDDC